MATFKETLHYWGISKYAVSGRLISPAHYQEGICGWCSFSTWKIPQHQMWTYILVCTWHKVHMSVPGRHQLLYYFEEAAIGKVKRSLKTVADACLRNDCSWIFPNQDKWDGGNCPAFIVFCVPFKPTTCTYNQVICWFSLNKISISGKATNSWRNSSCARVGCFRKNPDSCGTGPRC